MDQAGDMLAVGGLERGALRHGARASSKTLVIDLSLESLVQAVFRPGLRQDLQLYVGRLAPQGLVFGLDRLHLCEREEEHPFSAQPLQRAVVQGAQWNGLHLVAGGCFRHESRLHRAQAIGLDHIVAEDLLRHCV